MGRCGAYVLLLTLDLPAIRPLRVASRSPPGPCNAALPSLRKPSSLVLLLNVAPSPLDAYVRATSTRKYPPTPLLVFVDKGVGGYSLVLGALELRTS